MNYNSRFPDKKFFDIHFHAFNLSHPNFTAFVDRLNIEPTFKFTANAILNYISDNLKIFFQTLSRTGSLKRTIKRIKAEKGNPENNLSVRAMNLISIMDNDISDYFLYVEYYLRNDKQLNYAREFSGYEKFILTPLIIDFGLSEKKIDTKFEKKIFYRLPPQKTVIKQVKDLFSGIKRYYENEIVVSERQENGMSIFNIDHISSEIDINEKKRKKLFEIFPFMGINTKNYTLHKIEKILNQYFSKYDINKLSGENLYNEYYNKLGTFDGDVHSANFDFNFLFAGIKLYPPLGFDPYPEKELNELEKTNLLYSFCEKRGIPITTHCSDGGFVTATNNLELTSPDKWEKVLEKFPKLKLNLAHFGHQKNTSSPDSWRNKTIKLIKNYDNVYTDIGDLGINNLFYHELTLRIHTNNILADRIIFGSDFMINLLTNNSYNEYLFKFFDSDIDDGLKKRFCNTNPAKFLFG